MDIAINKNMRVCSNGDGIVGRQVDFRGCVRSSRRSIGIAAHIGGNGPLAVGGDHEVSRRLQRSPGANDDRRLETTCGVLNIGLCSGA